MKQPDLGRKISELRLAKGMTQGQLAGKCNVSLRTIQRIESAEVTPRSYTIRLIFETLDYEIYSSFGKFSYNLDRMAYKTRIWLGQLYKYVLDLFNLKTNTMKKLSILSVPIVSVVLIFLFISNSQAQSEDRAKKTITETNANFVKWFNSGKIDSLAMLYSVNACMIPDNYHAIYGRENIKDYYAFIYNAGFRFTTSKAESVIVSDPIVVERGIWKGNLPGELAGTYITQWKYEKGKWLIENEMTNSDQSGN
ncbi:MAG TPA: helix-turn-helix domain-containing protein [Bacteroidales bacterium]|nr:helix-turn-helix domain-containing protein [Bacteroidales bacterium]